MSFADELLPDFVDEVRSILEDLRAALERALDEPGDGETLAEIHRLVHTLKGSAAMMGFVRLSHVAAYAEESVEQLEPRRLDPTTAQTLAETVELVEGYLEGVLAGTLDERPILERAVRLYRGLRGREEAGDRRELERLLESDDPREVVRILAETRNGEDVTLASGVLASGALLQAFRQETTGLFAELDEALADLGELPADRRRERLRAVRDSVDTLKGATVLVGLAPGKRLCERIEGLLDRVEKEGVDAETTALLAASRDALAELAEGG